MKSVPTTPCTRTLENANSLSPVFLDKFDIILRFKIDKEFQIAEPIRIPLQKELQIFSRNELVIFSNGICIVQPPRKTHKSASITGKRIIQLVRGLPYQSGANKYQADDIAYCSERFPDGQVYRFQLDFVKAVVEQIRDFLQARFSSEVRVETLEVTCFEICHDGPLPPDVQDYYRRFETEVSKKYGFFRKETEFGSKDSDWNPKWHIPLNKKADQPSKDGECVWLKHYSNGETDRIEFRHESPTLESAELGDVFDELKRLGDRRFRQIYSLLDRTTEVIPEVDVASIRAKLLKGKVFKRADLKTDWGRHFLAEIATYRTYTPSKYKQDERVSPSRLERLCHETFGILLKRKIEDSNESSSNSVVFELRDDWATVDMTKFKSRGSDRKSFTPEALRKYLEAELFKIRLAEAQEAEERFTKIMKHFRLYANEENLDTYLKNLTRSTKPA